MCYGQIIEGKMRKEKSELCKAMIDENQGCVVYGGFCNYDIQDQENCDNYVPRWVNIKMEEKK